MKTKTGKERIGVLLLSIIVAISMLGCSFTFQQKAGAEEETAEQESTVLNVGVSGVNVRVSYDVLTGENKTKTITEDLTSKNDGKVRLRQLGTYVTQSLKWNEPLQEGETYSVAAMQVRYSINYPGKTAAEKENEENGNPDYKDREGSFYISPDGADVEGIGSTIRWDSEINTEIEKQEFASLAVKYQMISERTENAAGVEVSLDGKIYKTDDEGKITAKPDLTKEDAVGKKIEIAADDNFEGYNGTYDPSVEETIYLKERKTAKAGSDYAYGENISENGYVAKAGTYNIKGKNGTTLSTKREGEFGDTLPITVDTDGTCTVFYVKKSDGSVTKPVEKVLKIDSISPVITSIDSVNETKGHSINFYDYGMFTKTFADLTLTLRVKDNDSGMANIYITGKDKRTGTTEKYYPKTFNTDKNGYTVATFEIKGSDMSILENELTATAVDAVRNESAVALIRKTAEASTLVIEKNKPEISDIETSGTKSEHDWYRSDVDFKFSTQDEDSGLYSIRAEVNGHEVLDKKFTERNTSHNSYSFTLSKSLIESMEKDSGAYEAVITVTDNAGNVSVKTKTIHADIVAPSVSISGIEKEKHYKENPTLFIVNTEKHAGVEGSRIHLDVIRDGKVETSKDFDRAAEASFSSFGKDGIYRINIYAVDAAGNKSELKSTTFVKDSTAPKIDISGAEEGSFSNTAKKITVTVDERFYKTDDVKITVVRKLDGKTYQLSFPWKNNGKISVNSEIFSKTGTYTIKVSAVDEAGNMAETESLSFTVDRKNPYIKISNVTNEEGFSKEKHLKPVVTLKDNYLSDWHVSVKRSDEKTAEGLSRTVRKTDNGVIVSYGDFPIKEIYDGEYILSAWAKDRAGNVNTKKITFYIDRFGSMFIYSRSINTVKKTKYVNKIDRDLIITEHNVVSVVSKDDIKIDGVASDIKGVMQKTSDSGMNVYVHTYRKEDFRKEGVYTVNVISEDSLGNISESTRKAGRITFALDKTAPKASTDRKLDGKAYNMSSLKVNVDVQDNMTPASVSILLDGDEVSQKDFRTNKGKVSFTVPKGLNHKIKIVTSDAAGNKATYKIKNVTVSTNRVIRAVSHTGMPLWLIIVIIAAAAGAVTYLILRKRKKSQMADIHDEKNKKVE